MFAPYVDHALASRCVGTEYLIAALPERHKLATSSTVDLRALAREPLILPTRHETPGLFSRIRQLLDTASSARSG
jgi:hypothetical protein